MHYSESDDDDSDEDNDVIPTNSHVQPAPSTISPARPRNEEMAKDVRNGEVEMQPTTENMAEQSTNQEQIDPVLNTANPEVVQQNVNVGFVPTDLLGISEPPRVRTAHPPKPPTANVPKALTSNSPKPPTGNVPKSPTPTFPNNSTSPPPSTPNSTPGRSTSNSSRSSTPPPSPPPAYRAPIHSTPAISIKSNNDGTHTLSVSNNLFENYARITVEGNGKTAVGKLRTNIVEVVADQTVGILAHQTMSVAQMERAIKLKVQREIESKHVRYKGANVPAAAYNILVAQDALNAYTDSDDDDDDVPAAPRPNLLPAPRPSLQRKRGAAVLQSPNIVATSPPPKRRKVQPNNSSRPARPTAPTSNRNAARPIRAITPPRISTPPLRLAQRLAARRNATSTVAAQTIKTPAKRQAFLKEDDKSTKKFTGFSFGKGNEEKQSEINDKETSW
ncbi:unnamed protein product [Caenorhabditis angaria]|uniref:Uncharacterized protein n=1 Tax=Caenorhabditis angaria TaxID=860376 RepID=A0A9P1I4Z9_9PELO|nr:unnamed protein product [Caenorhabditis angaria]